MKIERKIEKSESLERTRACDWPSAAMAKPVPPGARAGYGDKVSRMFQAQSRGIACVRGFQSLIYRSVALTQEYWDKRYVASGAKLYDWYVEYDAFRETVIHVWQKCSGRPPC